MPTIKERDGDQAAIHDSPSGGMESKRRSAGAVGFIALVFVTVIGFVDNHNNPAINLSLFYLLVVTFAAWFGGRNGGMLIALASALAMFIHEIKLAEVASPGWPNFVNLGMHAATFLFVSLLVSSLRTLNHNLERRIQERTVELETEIGDRKRTAEELGKMLQQFRQLADTIADVFWIRNVGEKRMAYVSPAYEAIWGRSSRELYKNPDLWMAAIHPEDRERVARVIQDSDISGGFNQEYRIVRPDSTLRWIRERAFPIRDRAGKLVRVVGIAEDFTERHQLEREILEISDREQARIGQDLHDGLCQKLVSLAFDNNSLEKKLADAGMPEAEVARQMGDAVDDLITEARAVSRGLHPVQLEADGFRLALHHLAETVGSRCRVACRLECPKLVFVGNETVATHLYRIAQESVNNAVKHAKAGLILIRLEADDHLVKLEVVDDGIGISIQADSPSPGIGLHTMAYRARTIGGSLSVMKQPGGGTRVTCVAPWPSA